MVRGLFSAGSAMLAYQARQDLLANDLANASTPGYRPQDVAVEAFPEMLVHEEVGDGRTPVGFMGTGAFVGRSYVRFDPAPLRYTGRTLDVALEGDGFFTVETEAGVRLTRAGDFTVSAGGLLVTQDGHVVLGTDGPIRMGAVDASEVAITEEGAILTSDGAYLGQLLLVDVPDRTRLEPEGRSLFRPTADSGEPTATAARVEQGSLEGSGVSVVRSMVEMISGLRAYQAAQQAVRAEDEMTAALIAQVGRAA